MEYFIKKRLQRFNRGEKASPLQFHLRGFVLYAKDAVEIMNRLVPELCNNKAGVRIVSEKGTKYWMREHGDIVYAIEIGRNPLFIAMDKKSSLLRFSEVVSTDFDVLIKDCSSDTKENTQLCAKVHYCAEEKELYLIALVLNGVDIRNFPHDYWNVKTMADQPVNDIGCSGLMRFGRASDSWDINFGGLEVYDTVSLWTGYKILKEFTPFTQDFTPEQMTAYWKNFWKVCGN